MLVVRLLDRLGVPAANALPGVAHDCGSKNFVFAEVSSSLISLRHPPFMRESASRPDHAAMSLPSTSRPFAAARQFAMAYSTRVKSNEVLAMAMLRLLGAVPTFTPTTSSRAA
jgi:hypothetical protein